MFYFYGYYAKEAHDGFYLGMECCKLYPCLCLGFSKVTRVWVCDKLWHMLSTHLLGWGLFRPLCMPN